MFLFSLYIPNWSVSKHLNIWFSTIKQKIEYFYTPYTRLLKNISKVQIIRNLTLMMIHLRDAAKFTILIWGLKATGFIQNDHA